MASSSTSAPSSKVRRNASVDRVSVLLFRCCAGLLLRAPFLPLAPLAFSPSQRSTSFERRAKAHGQSSAAGLGRATWPRPVRSQRPCTIAWAFRRRTATRVVRPPARGSTPAPAGPFCTRRWPRRLWVSRRGAPSSWCWPTAGPRTRCPRRWKSSAPRPRASTNRRRCAACSPRLPKMPRLQVRLTGEGRGSGRDGRTGEKEEEKGEGKQVDEWGGGGSVARGRCLGRWARRPSRRGPQALSGVLLAHSIDRPASAGRMITSRPNMQCLPRPHPLVVVPGECNLRRAVVASPGFVLVSADYRNLEYRIMAHCRCVGCARIARCSRCLRGCGFAERLGRRTLSNAAAGEQGERKSRRARSGRGRGSLQ